MADLDINSIINSLSKEDMENIKNMASSLMGSNKIEGGGDKPKENSFNLNSLGDMGNVFNNLGIEPKSQNEKSSDFSGLGMPDLSKLGGLLPIVKAFNTHDERIDFINALKPLLSPEKRGKADEAMKLIRLISVLPLLKERGLM